MKEFMKVCNLESLVKGPTCFIDPDKPCIDLITTNKGKDHPRLLRLVYLIFTKW